MKNNITKFFETQNDSYLLRRYERLQEKSDKALEEAINKIMANNKSERIFRAFEYAASLVLNIKPKTCNKDKTIETAKESYAQKGTIDILISKGINELEKNVGLSLIKPDEMNSEKAKTLVKQYTDVHY